MRGRLRCFRCPTPDHDVRVALTAAKKCQGRHTEPAPEGELMGRQTQPSGQLSPYRLHSG